MNDNNISEPEEEWELSNDIIRNSDNFSDHSFTPWHIPGEVNLDVYPLSPHFEDCSLEDLWNEPTPSSVYKPLTSNAKTTVKKANKKLKALSWSVKEIVEKHSKRTYKEVADELLVELGIDCRDSTSKAEKNVRRRVYDALNVLVAADVIIKQGKHVSPKELKDSLPVEGNESLIHKREKLKGLVDSYTTSLNLYERNRMQNRASKVLAYPLSIISLDKDTTYDVNSKQVQMRKSAEDTSVVIKVNGECELLKDIKILKKIGLHRKSSDLPLELIRLCRQN